MRQKRNMADYPFKAYVSHRGWRTMNKERMKKIFAEMLQYEYYSDKQREKLNKAIQEFEETY